MTIYKSKSGQTALKLNDEITSAFCSCFRLDSELWHHVGDTEPFDPSIKAAALKEMLNEMVEELDKQEFDLSKSMSEIKRRRIIIILKNSYSCFLAGVTLNDKSKTETKGIRLCSRNYYCLCTLFFPCC